MCPAFTIGISGGSGSGKTFFIRKVASYFRSEDICLLSQDHYYFPKESQKLDDKGIENFDLPESIDHTLFIEHLKCLKNGKPISKEEYTFNKESPIPPATITLNPAPILLVEGLFILVNSEVEQELDLKIFIEAKDHVKLSRRIARDKIERGYDLDDVLYRFENHVMPVYETLIEPQKHKADFIIPNHKSFDKALDILVAGLKDKLKV
jgi:uridine kinase